MEKYRNPKKVRDLKNEVLKLKEDLAKAERLLRQEKGLVPVGYELVNPGETVMPGALGFEPYNGNWSKAGNSVGCIVNEQGYVSEYTHSGWKYANPLNS
jgi:hypothetical protein